MILTSLIVGFVFAGATVGCLAAFWDDIKEWLNTVAADAVEKAFGYNARKHIHKAVAIIDRVVDKLRNTSTVYTKKSKASTYFDKTTITCEAGIADVDADIQEELRKNGNRMVQEFTYVH